MRIIVLKGPTDSGKSTVLNSVYDELISFRGVLSTPKRIVGDPKQRDFECIVTLKDQRRIAFFTMGDYFKYLTPAVDKYKYLECEILIIALNDEFQDKLNDLVQDFPYNVIHKSTPFQGDISKSIDCGKILSII